MKNNGFLKSICWAILVIFCWTSVVPSSYAQTLSLPKPGTLLGLSLSSAPALLRGIKVDVKEPFKFDFILDQGTSGLKADALNAEANKLIRYFMASLTIPEKDLWVNLSPFEKDRIIADEFSLTEMGRDLLAQDYILKQITASLIYPENETGKAFWAEVYQKAYEKFGTADVPVDTFNKVWVMPQKAVVYENGAKAFVMQARLKVMLESDYRALSNSEADASDASKSGPLTDMTKDILRQVVIPVIEKEINEGANFAQLRQIYYALILAKWYKETLKDSILNRKYSDQKKVAGVDLAGKEDKEFIYSQYLEAFKKGAFNFVREERDAHSQEMLPRKYFSGGASFYFTEDAWEKTSDFASGSVTAVGLQRITGAWTQKGPVDLSQKNKDKPGDPPVGEWGPSRPSDARTVKQSQQAFSYADPVQDFQGVDLEHFVVAQNKLVERKLSDTVLGKLEEALGISPAGQDREVVYQGIYSRLIEKGYTRDVVDIINGSSYQDPRLSVEIIDQNKNPKGQGVLEAVSNSLDALGFGIGQFGKGVKQVIDWLTVSGGDRIDVYTSQGDGHYRQLSILQDVQGQNYIQVRDISVDRYKEALGEDALQGTAVRITTKKAISAEGSSGDVNSQQSLVDGVHKRFPFVTSVEITTQMEGDAPRKVNGFEEKRLIVPAQLDDKISVKTEGRSIRMKVSSHAITIVDNGKGMNAETMARMFVPRQGTKHPQPLSGQTAMDELAKVKVVHDPSLAHRVSFARNSEVIVGVEIPDDIVEGSTVGGGLMVEFGGLLDVPESRDSIVIPLNLRSGERSNFQLVVEHVIDRIIQHPKFSDAEKLRYINTIVVGLKGLVKGNENYAHVIKLILAGIKRSLREIISRLKEEDFVILPHEPGFKDIAIPDGKKALFIDKNIFDWNGATGFREVGGSVVPGITLGGDKRLFLVTVPFREEVVKNSSAYDRNWHMWPQEKRIPLLKDDGFIAIPMNFPGTARLLALAQAQLLGDLNEQEDAEFRALLQEVNILTAEEVVTSYEIHKPKDNLLLADMGIKESKGAPDSEAINRFLLRPPDVSLPDKKSLKPIKTISREEGKLDRPDEMAFNNDGKMYVVNEENESISIINDNRTLDKVITKEEGKFYYPQKPVPYEGKMYVVNEGNNTISVLNNDGTLDQVIPRLQGNFFGLMPPVFYEGKMYVVNNYGNNISVLNIDGTLDRMISQKQGQFSSPYDLVFKDRKMYVTNWKNYSISVLNDDDTLDRVIPEEEGKFAAPRGPVFMNGKIYVVNWNNNTISVLNDDGTFVRVISQKEGQLYGPQEPVLRDDRMFIVNVLNDSISVFNADGVLEEVIRDDVLLSPGTPVLNDGKMYISCRRESNIAILEWEGGMDKPVVKGKPLEIKMKFVKDITQREGRLRDPSAPVFNKDGQMFVRNGTDSISVFNADGTLNRVISNEEGKFSSVYSDPVFDENDKMYVVVGNDDIAVFNKEGSLDKVISGKQGRFNQPAPPVFYDGKMYVINRGSDHMSVLRLDGTFDREISQEHFFYPETLVFHDNKMFVANNGRDEQNTLVVLDLDGTLNRVISQAQGKFDSPRAPVFKDGKMYILNQGNDTVSVLNDDGSLDRVISYKEKPWGLPKSLVFQDGRMLVMCQRSLLIFDGEGVLDGFVPFEEARFASSPHLFRGNKIFGVKSNYEDISVWEWDDSLLKPAPGSKPFAVKSVKKISSEQGKFGQPANFSFNKEGKMFVMNGDSDIVALNMDGTFDRIVLNEGGGFGSPEPPVFDKGGKMYIADKKKETITVFNVDGTLDRIIAEEEGQFNTPLFPVFDKGGKMYVANKGDNTISVFNADGTLDRIISQEEGRFNAPVSPVFDKDGKMYVVNEWDETMSVFNVDGTLDRVISEEDGRFNFPVSPVFDKDGKMYVVNQGKDIISVFNKDGGFARITSIKGGDIISLVVDEDGKMHIAIREENNISFLNADGELERHISAEEGLFNDPRSLVLRDGYLYVLNLGSNDISVLELESGRAKPKPESRPFVVKSVRKISSKQGKYKAPADIAFNKAGKMFVPDEQGHSVSVFNTDGVLDRVIPRDEGHFNGPLFVVFRNDGKMYVVNSEDDSISVFNVDGAFERNIPQEEGFFELSGSPIFDKEGKMYVPHNGTSAMSVFHADGTFDRVIPKEERGFYAAFDKTGKMYVISTNDTVSVFNVDGTLNRVISNKEGRFSSPENLAFDKDGKMYVKNRGNDTISVFNVDGSFDKIFSIAKGWGPTGFVLDEDGKMYIIVRSAAGMSFFNVDGGLENFVSTKEGMFDDPDLPNFRNGKMYVLNFDSNDISVLELENGKAKPHLEIKPPVIKSVKRLWQKRGRIKDPEAIAFNKNGKMYVANNGDDTVAIFNENEEFERDVPQEEGQFSKPCALLFKDGKMYVVNNKNNTLSILNEDGTFDRVVPQEEGLFDGPSKIVSNGSKIYVLNKNNDTISILNENGRWESAALPEEGVTAHYYELLSNGIRLYAVNEDGTIVILNNDGTLDKIIPKKEGLFDAPTYPVFNKDGKMYNLNIWHEIIGIFSADGTLDKVIPPKEGHNSFLCRPVFDEEGKMYVMDLINNTMSVYNKDGDLEQVVPDVISQDIKTDHGPVSMGSPVFRDGKIYFLDTDLGSVFVVELENGKAKPKPQVKTLSTEAIELWKSQVVSRRDGFIAQMAAVYSPYFDLIPPQFKGEVEGLTQEAFKKIYQQQQSVIEQRYARALNGQPLDLGTALPFDLFVERFNKIMPRLADYVASVKDLVSQEEYAAQKKFYSALFGGLLKLAVDPDLNLQEADARLFTALAYGWEVRSQEQLDAVDTIARMIQDLQDAVSQQATLPEIVNMVEFLSHSAVADHGRNSHVVQDQLKKILAKKPGVKAKFLVQWYKAFKGVSSEAINSYLAYPDKPHRLGQAREFVIFLTQDVDALRTQEIVEPQGISVQMPAQGVEVSRIIKLEEDRPKKDADDVVMDMDYFLGHVNDLPARSDNLEAGILKDMTVQGESGVYTREIVQNSSDATRTVGGTLTVDFYISPETGEYVEEAADDGTGALSEVALLIPRSTKALGEQKELTGFFGTGKYTELEGVDRFEIINRNDSRAYMFRYDVTKDEGGNPVALRLTAIKKIDDPRVRRGNTVRRIKKIENTIPELDAMLAKRAWKTFTGLAQNDHFKIYLTDAEGQQQPLVVEKEVLSETDFIFPSSAAGQGGNLGKMRMISTKDMPSQIVERSGLRVSEMKEEYLEFIPAEMRKHLKELGIVIQIPLPLIRNRSAFEHEDEYLFLIRKYVALEFYKALVYKGLTQTNPQFVFHGLPLDWETNDSYWAEIGTDDKDLVALADKINKNNYNAITEQELRGILPSDRQLDKEMRLVKVLLLLEVPVGEKGRQSFLLRRLAVQKKVDAQKAEAQFKSFSGMGFGMSRFLEGTEVPDFQSKVFSGNRIRMGHEQMRHPEKFIVPEEKYSEEEKKFVELASSVARHFGLEKVILMDDHVVFSGAFGNYKGKNTFFLARSLADRVADEAIDTVIHELAHFLETLIEKDALILMRQGYISSLTGFTHQAVGLFAEAMKYVALISLADHGVQGGAVAILGSTPGARADNAEVGGIDLDPGRFSIEKKGIPVSLDWESDPKSLEAVQIDGLVPVIMNIEQMDDLPQYLGAHAHAAM